VLLLNAAKLQSLNFCDRCLQPELEFSAMQQEPD